MKKITLKWFTVGRYMKENMLNGVNRMGLLYGTKNGEIDKSNEITIFDRLILTNDTIHKEGIAIYSSGNPHKLDFETDTIFLEK